MGMKPYLLTESDYVHQDALSYPFEERGLQFGDGVYEVIRIYGGRFYQLHDHIDRLYRSAEAIKLEVPYEKAELLEKLATLLEKNSVTTDAKLYLQVTRGSAPRDHAFPVGVGANLYAYIADLTRKTEEMKHGVSVITHEDERWQNCYIKSLNLLPNVLAKQTAKEHGAYEAILHRGERVTECSSSNVFLVKDGSVYTHPETNQILHGCVRTRVRTFCQEAGIPFVEQSFTVEDLQDADELFLTSTTSEIVPIVKVDGSAVQDGKPGDLTQKLQRAYEADAQIEHVSVFQT
ncbi:D-amino acid aminotransferase [Pontibacillus halophilus JSM 076056 = DSM 19796]|uniref:D-alanine aminotransferase n=1 Tax=Pontibacillus halophilus JSM 076056 = DSM 19796 TaxID=1385510 RepID=A0A0A5GMV7_9BACI|nr:D-amino-acid transaminase [Pontibacillus halophilus]KGX92543.1 D-amino acid aminotransferase [Pontibacillus halophilus JSM 076056 = DSM 19796]